MESPFGSLFPGLPKAPERPKRPSLPKMPGLDGPAIPEPSVPLPPGEDVERETRWREWQASAATARSGTNSLLEFICWEYLVDKKKLVPDRDFFYQSPFFGGRTRAGGTVVDFYFPDRGLAWNPAGLRFHFTDPSDRGHDLLVQRTLAGRGIKLIYLFEDDLLQRPEYALNMAWKGVQLPR